MCDRHLTGIQLYTLWCAPHLWRPAPICLLWIASHGRRCRGILSRTLYIGVCTRGAVLNCLPLFLPPPLHPPQPLDALPAAATNCHRSCYSLALSAAKPIKESLGATCGGGAEIFLAEQANV